MLEQPGQKKEMMMVVVAGEEREPTKKELVERRQEVVAGLMLERKSVRQIQAELARLALDPDATTNGPKPLVRFHKGILGEGR